MPFGPKGLVVTWVGPVPEQAEVSYTDGEVFATVNRANGPDVPKDLPQKYSQGLTRVDVFNASMSWDAQSLTAWEKRHGIEMEPEPLRIFEDYLRSKHVLFSTLVRHPDVPEPKLYARCSIVLQRGIIVYSDGVEDLYLRSYFHSAKDDKSFVNFAPRGALRMSFRSEKLWFPLELTRVIQEPSSVVILDLLTTKALNREQLPKSFRAVGGKGTVSLNGKSYHSVRVVAKLAAKEKSPDFVMSAP